MNPVAELSGRIARPGPGELLWPWLARHVLPIPFFHYRAYELATIYPVVIIVKELR